MSRWITIAMLAVVAVFWAAPAMAGWEATEWNMTPEQVEAHMPGVHPTRMSAQLKGVKGRNRGPYVFAGLKLNATYYYDDHGLAMVMLDAPAGKCPQVAKALLEAYGPPLTASDQIFFQVFVWHDEPEQTRVRLLTSQAGFCSLYFERLSDYRAKDLLNVRK
ncbi:MAG: hypothetical protein JWO33_2206 [Caulobacteraceae bacterium]|nr:hypothetical protein [Caulobacteraceae bacterium]